MTFYFGASASKAEVLETHLLLTGYKANYVRFLGNAGAARVESKRGGQEVCASFTKPPGLW